MWTVQVSKVLERRWSGHIDTFGEPQSDVLWAFYSKSNPSLGSWFEAKIMLKLIFEDSFGVQGVKIYDIVNYFFPGLGPFESSYWTFLVIFILL